MRKRKQAGPAMDLAGTRGAPARPARVSLIRVLMAGALLCCGVLFGLPGSVAKAQAQSASAPSHKGLTADEFSSQSRKVIHRAPRRVRIFTPRTLGPNAVRICNAHYEQEYRPSGTVIVPRMQCYWSN